MKRIRLTPSTNGQQAASPQTQTGGACRRVLSLRYGQLKMKRTALNIVLFCTLLSGCTPRILQCYLKFDGVNKTFEFAYSKQELKKRIIQTYTYNESLLLLNLGKTPIENAAVNTEYRRSTDVWLDKNNWDRFKSEISDKTTDTLNVIIGKHHSRRTIDLVVVISGDENKSWLTLQSFSYKRARKCQKDENYYRMSLTIQIQKKFIDKLK